MHVNVAHTLLPGSSSLIDVDSRAVECALKEGAAPQASMLAGCALLYHACLHKPLHALAAEPRALLRGSAWGIPLPVILFGGLIALSRVGMWSYEMVDTQLFQMVRCCAPVPPLPPAHLGKSWAGLGGRTAQCLGRVAQGLSRTLPSHCCPFRVWNAGAGDKACLLAPRRCFAPLPSCCQRLNIAACM
jgi:hypothetical protein